MTAERCRGASAPVGRGQSRYVREILTRSQCRLKLIADPVRPSRSVAVRRGAHFTFDRGAVASAGRGASRGASVAAGAAAGVAARITSRNATAVVHRTAAVHWTAAIATMTAVSAAMMTAAMAAIARPTTAMTTIAPTGAAVTAVTGHRLVVTAQQGDADHRDKNRDAQYQCTIHPQSSTKQVPYVQDPNLPSLPIRSPSDGEGRVPSSVLLRRC